MPTHCCYDKLSLPPAISLRTQGNVGCMQDPRMFRFALEELKPWSCDIEGRYHTRQPVGPMQGTCPVWQMCFLDPSVQCACLGKAAFLASLWKRSYGYQKMDCMINWGSEMSLSGTEQNPCLHSSSLR